MRSLRSRLTYANVMSSLAMFLVLGGVSYAAATLPRNSVGTKQLRRNAVTNSKLTNGSVGRHELRSNVRRQLDRSGARGPQGPAGPGAKRVHFSAPGTVNPKATTILRVNGLTMAVNCGQNSSGTTLTTQIRSDSAGTFYDQFVVDQGTDPSSPGSTNVGSLQQPLPGGSALSAPQPAVDTGYFRAFATVHVVLGSSTTTLHIVTFTDGDSDRCTVEGTAVPT
jgi:hypothetical protein